MVLVTGHRVHGFGHFRWIRILLTSPSTATLLTYSVMRILLWNSHCALDARNNDVECDREGGLAAVRNAI